MFLVSFLSPFIKSFVIWRILCFLTLFKDMLLLDRIKDEIIVFNWQSERLETTTKGIIETEILYHAYLRTTINSYLFK